MTMDQLIELLKVLGILAWPVLAIIAFLVLFPFLKSFLSRDKVTIKIGGMELTAEQAAQSLTTLVNDLQEKVAQIEQKISADAPNKASEVEHLQLPIRRGEKPRVLWVDDVPSNVAIQVAKLMADGFWVDIATTTAQALAMSDLTKFDLVITDIGRKEEGVHRPDAGIVFAREIRTRDQNIPIVAFTTHQNLSRFSEAARKAGINYLTNSTVDLYRYIDSLTIKGRNAN